jgi:2-oxoglutarate ferredoxin oxidoreductase subunit gamma
MSKQSLKNYINKLKPGGTLIYDSSLLKEPKKDGIIVYGIPATKLASENLKIKGVANIVMLGALIQITQIINKEAIEKTIKEVFPEKFWEADIKALNIGIEVAKKLVKLSQQASRQQK